MVRLVLDRVSTRMRQPDDARLTASCTNTHCLAPGTDVTTNVTVFVMFPGVPSVARSYIPVQIPVSASHVTTVDELRAAQ